MGTAFTKKKDILYVANISIVHIFSKQSAKSPRVMISNRPLVIMALKNNIQFKAQDIPGK